MTTTQNHYSLRWNNHRDHMLTAFDTLLQTKTLVDVTLVCAETSIRAHKMVLSACSPFFQRVFAETPCKHPVIVLKDFHGWVVQAIVDFMYRGEIKVSQKRLQTLIQAGESLQVRGLVENSVPQQNTPTPSVESPADDDYDDGLLDTSLLSDDLGGRCSSYDDVCPTMVSSTGTKLMLQSHMFHSSTTELNNNHNGNNNNNNNSVNQNISRSELCQSPSSMPRRKQARPRRRSGDCDPQENNNNENSKPGTPIPIENTDDRSDDDGNPDDDDEDDVEAEIDNIRGGESDDDGNNEDIPNCGKEINKDICKDLEENENLLPNSEENDPDMIDSEKQNFNNNNNNIRKRNFSNNRENSVSEVPENLCTKKSKKDDSDTNEVNNTINNNNSNNNNNNNNNNSINNNNNSTNNNNNSNNNNNHIVLSLKDIRHLNKQSSISRSPNQHQIQHHHHHHNHHNPFHHQPHHNNRIQSIKDIMKNESDDIIGVRSIIENDRDSSPIPFDQIDLSMAAAAAAAHHHQQQQQLNNNFLGAGTAPSNVGHHSSQHHRDKIERLEESLASRLNKEFTPSSPMSLPSHFNHPDGPQHPPSPLPFPGMSSALTLTSPHMFGLDSPLALFPPGMDPGKLYNPLMEMSDPRGMPNDHPPFLKKKMPRPKGQHSAPRGGPPRSWTNAELTEALQHVWNKKMTTSQASRIFGIPYNSLLMYVRGKYGKSLKLEQLRKDCISGPPIELLTMGISGSSGGGGNGNAPGSGTSSGNSKNHDSRTKELKDLDATMQRIQQQTEADLLQGPNPLFNPFPPGFYPDFAGGFPGLPLGMLNLLPPERHPQSSLHMNMIDEDCKSDRSKQSLDDDFPVLQSASQQQQQQQQLNRDLDRRELLMQQNGQD